MENAIPSNMLYVSVVAPSGSLFEGVASSVQVPSHDGLLGVLPGHAPLLGLLGTGLLVCNISGQEKKEILVHGGFLEVSGNKVTVLANQGEDPASVDSAKAAEAYAEELKKPAHGDHAIGEKLQTLASLRARKHYGKK